MADLSKQLQLMKRIMILLLALMPMISCIKAPKEKVVINGDRSVYALLDSTLYLPTKDTTEFNVKIYEGEQGLMLESPRPISGNLFGIKSTTGFRDRLKYDFTFINIKGENYIYGIHFSDFSSFWGRYYIENLEYCWIFYQYDDYSNKPDMVEFSPSEFDRFFRKTKAHLIN